MTFIKYLFRYKHSMALNQLKAKRVWEKRNSWPNRKVREMIIFLVSIYLEFEFISHWTMQEGNTSQYETESKLFLIQNCNQTKANNLRKKIGAKSKCNVTIWTLLATPISIAMLTWFSIKKYNFKHELLMIILAEMKSN